MKKKISTAVVLVLVAALFATSFAKLHFIRADGGGGAVLWNSESAYLFLSDCDSGFVFNVPEYLAEPIREYFRAPTFPVNNKCVLSVIRVTQSKVERHDLELKGSFGFFTPIDGAIYADCPGGTCKWNGEKFELVPKEEELRLGGYSTLSKQEFTGVNGWSERWIRGTSVGEAPTAVKFSVEVDPRTTLLVHGTNPVSIDLQRSSGASEKLWYHEQHTRLVSGATYQRVFTEN